MGGLQVPRNLQRGGRAVRSAPRVTAAGCGAFWGEQLLWIAPSPHNATCGQQLGATAGASQADLNGDGHLELVMVTPDLKLQVRPACTCVCGPRTTCLPERGGAGLQGRSQTTLKRAGTTPMLAGRASQASRPSGRGLCTHRAPNRGVPPVQADAHSDRAAAGEGAACVHACIEWIAHACVRAFRKQLGGACG